MEHKLPSTKILGTNITIASKSTILEYIFNVIEKKKEKIYIVTPNPEILVYATRSSAYQKVLNDARVSLADGVGVVVADKILKNHGLVRLTGVDLVELLCQESAKRGFSVGFLGGRDGVAERSAERLTKKYPRLRVNYISEEWNGLKSDFGLQIPEQEGKSLEFINTRGDGSRIKSGMTVKNQKSEIRPQTSEHIDILFVAFGAPKQEEWIARHIADLPVTVAMGVGGAFDYFSGSVPRAPKVVRDIGMEWMFRLIRQPWRAKRQLALLMFAYLVMKEKWQG